MKIRTQKLWQLPLYYLAASWLSFYAIVLAGPFFTNLTTDETGASVLSADPMRLLILHGIILAAVILIGGLWLCRSMTHREIAVSAGILSAVFLVPTVCNLAIPGWHLPIFLVYFQTVNGIVSSALFRLTGQFELSAYVASFTPMLFVLFGKKAAEQRHSS